MSKYKGYSSDDDYFSANEEDKSNSYQSDYEETIEAEDIQKLDDILSVSSSEESDDDYKQEIKPENDMEIAKQLYEAQKISFEKYQQIQEEYNNAINNYLNSGGKADDLRKYSALLTKADAEHNANFKKWLNYGKPNEDKQEVKVFELSEEDKKHNEEHQKTIDLIERIIKRSKQQIEEVNASLKKSDAINVQDREVINNVNLSDSSDESSYNSSSSSSEDENYSSSSEYVNYNYEHSTVQRYNKWKLENDSSDEDVGGVNYNFSDSSSSSDENISNNTNEKIELDSVITDSLPVPILQKILELPSREDIEEFIASNNKLALFATDEFFNQITNYQTKLHAQKLEKGECGASPEWTYRGLKYYLEQLALTTDTQKEIFDIKKFSRYLTDINLNGINNSWFTDEVAEAYNRLLLQYYDKTLVGLLVNISITSIEGTFKSLKNLRENNYELYRKLESSLKDVKFSNSNYKNHKLVAFNIKLIEAIENNSIDEVKKLASIGVPLPLDELQESDNEKVFEYFKEVENFIYKPEFTLEVLKNRPNEIKYFIRAADDSNETALFIVCGNNEIKLAKLLIRNGAEINISYGISSLLHRVIFYEYNKEFDLLINQPKLNVNLLDDEGRTPLMRAIDSQGMNGNKIYFISQLLKHPNINLDLKDNYGNSTLDYVLASNNLEFIQEFIDYANKTSDFKMFEVLQDKKTKIESGNNKAHSLRKKELSKKEKDMLDVYAFIS